MKGKDLISAAENWYMSDAVCKLLDEIIGSDSVIHGWYEVFRVQQSDGSFTARYFICTQNNLMALSVTGEKLDLNVYPLSLLQKVSGKVSCNPVRGMNWGKAEWIFRFAPGGEMLILDIPSKSDEVDGFFAVLRRLLS
ncbi:MAG: hypothetical protein U1D96_03830 [Eubacteriales bacterium]|jgi:hypothetical protein|nr:hypothetical protein [Pseudomonadota bacterium]MBU4532589.1 hypothetical protein [Bacillota bacterium]MBV1728534.1 hypothetical protein [Desulforudis sp.]MDP3050611.1 hypothetical protein [Eubacteriales bacterium]MDQ7789132.1 hypothetical protein [Clostridia bacterium]